MTLGDDQTDATLRALSHPVPRELVRACLRSPRSAGDLTDLVALAPASVSEHLRVLHTSGLLELERDGRFRMYRTNATVVRQVATLVARIVG